MKQAKLALLVVLPCLFTHASLALPKICPSVTAIIASSFTSAEFNTVFNKWYVRQNNKKYDTDHAWDFAILVDATTRDEAFDRASEAVKSLASPVGPSSAGSGTFICQYQLPTGPQAMAFFPTAYPEL